MPASLRTTSYGKPAGASNSASLQKTRMRLNSAVRSNPESHHTSTVHAARCNLHSATHAAPSATVPVPHTANRKPPPGARRDLQAAA
eukprot:7730548-Alexandrium_andersonii.AAC.1